MNGASNFSAERLASALEVSAANGLAAYVAVQPPYNLLEIEAYESGVAKLAAANHRAAWPYYGLASGFLTGKYRPGIRTDSARARRAGKYADDRGYRVVTALGEIAAARRVAISAVALAWLAQQATVMAPIASARTTGPLHDLLALPSLTLADGELAALRAAARLRP